MLRYGSAADCNCNSCSTQASPLWVGTHTVSQRMVVHPFHPQIPHHPGLDRLSGSCRSYDVWRVSGEGIASVLRGDNQRSVGANRGRCRAVMTGSIPVLANMRNIADSRWETYKRITSSIVNGDMMQYKAQSELYQVLMNLQAECVIEDDPIVYEYAIKACKYARQMAYYMVSNAGSDEAANAYYELYWKFMLFEAQHHQVDSGLIYLEKNRQPKDRFYEPRRAVFMKHGIMQAFQDLIDDKIDFMAVSLPPGSGKTSIEIFVLSLVGGWYPNDFNLSSAHSAILTRSLYDGILEILNDPVEYTWHEIFPGATLQGTNAKETTINLDRPGRFKTWTMRSIDGSLTGATRANRFLTADDLVSGIEEALNKNRLETLWSKVTNDLFSRMLDGCKQLFFATRWSTADPIGRMYDMYHTNPRARFIAVPALDENGESNFMYDFNGFSKEYFLMQQRAMDEISFNALYQQKPIEREGLLFPPSKLRRFFRDKSEVPEETQVFAVMPNRDPDAIWAVCDTKDKGSDFQSMPIAYQFGEDFYILDVVFDDTADYDILDRKTADMLIYHNPQLARFESNSAGGRVADNIEKMIKGECRTQIETKYTTANKETKILVNSDWIMKHCLFLDPACYAPNTDYGKFIGNICSYTTRAKVPHDDAPDSMAQLSEFIAERLGRTHKTRIVKSLF